MTDHPSTKDVTKYFLIGTAVHTAVSLALPKPYRDYWQYIGLGTQIGVGTYGLFLGVNLKD